MIIIVVIVVIVIIIIISSIIIVWIWSNISARLFSTVKFHCWNTSMVDVLMSPLQSLLLSFLQWWHQSSRMHYVCIHMGGVSNRGTPKSSIFNRIFHSKKPFILRYHWYHYSRNPLFLYRLTSRFFTFFGWQSSWESRSGSSCQTSLTSVTPA